MPTTDTTDSQTDSQTATRKKRKKKKQKRSTRGGFNQARKGEGKSRRERQSEEETHFMHAYVRRTQKQPQNV